MWIARKVGDSFDIHFCEIVGCQNGVVNCCMVLRRCSGLLQRNLFSEQPQKLHKELFVAVWSRGNQVGVDDKLVIVKEGLQEIPSFALHFM